MKKEQKLKLFWHSNPIWHHFSTVFETNTPNDHCVWYESSRSEHKILKFIIAEKAKKIRRNLPVDQNFSKHQSKWEISVYFYGLLRIYKLYVCMYLKFHNLLHSNQQDLITLQRNFEVVSNLVDDLKNEKNSLKDKLELLRQEGHANNASLNRQRELLHQDRLAFTHQRIAFDNHTMVGISQNLSKNYDLFFLSFRSSFGSSGVSRI